MADSFSDLAASLPYGGAPLPGIVTAGQLSAEQLERIAAAGCSTVIDLRGVAEPRGYDEPAAVARAGLEYVPIPVTAESLSDAEFTAVRDRLRARGDLGVVVHCASANRVGALLIPYLMLDEGKNEQESLEVARRVGLRSPELAAKAFDYVHRTRASSP
jgi:protein tyrosine phosphatase (PTP) superfamily phosphohydrolase (DUF442 family)